MDSSTDFNNIYLSSTAKAGKASFTAEAIEWRATKTSEPALLADASTLHKATWTELGQHASLQLYLKGYEEPVPVGRDTSDEERPVGEEKRFYRLSDFSAKDEDLVRRLVARVDSGLELEKEPVDVRGLNMGEFVLDSHKQCISVRSEVGLVAEIPLTGVSQVVTAGKSEVEIQYLARRGDEITGGDQCELMTVRMHVPEDAEDMDMTDIWAANIKAACDVQEDEQGDSVLCEIPDEIANFLAPRGKYRMELHKDFFRMRGKTYDFKVLYSAVSAVYLLEKPDLTMGLEHDREVKTKIVLNKLLVISLDTPVRQGQQRYPHLVIQLANEPGTINLQMTEEQIAALYGDNGTATLAPVRLFARCGPSLRA
jgi:structure-specific recognition protein 1